MLTLLLSAASLASAAQIPKLFTKTFSEVNQAQQCQQAINVFKQGPANYQSILGSGVKYTDTAF